MKGKDLTRQTNQNEQQQLNVWKLVRIKCVGQSTRGWNKIHVLTKTVYECLSLTTLYITSIPQFKHSRGMQTVHQKQTKSLIYLHKNLSNFKSIWDLQMFDALVNYTLSDRWIFYPSLPSPLRVVTKVSPLPMYKSLLSITVQNKLIPLCNHLIPGLREWEALEE